MEVRPGAVGSWSRWSGPSQGPLGRGLESGGGGRGRGEAAKTVGMRAGAGGAAMTVGMLPGAVGVLPRQLGGSQGPWRRGQGSGSTPSSAVKTVGAEPGSVGGGQERGGTVRGRGDAAKTVRAGPWPCGCSQGPWGRGQGRVGTAKDRGGVAKSNGAR